VTGQQVAGERSLYLGLDFDTCVKRAASASHSATSDPFGIVIEWAGRRIARVLRVSPTDF
jgi:hypothetical protein